MLDAVLLRKAWKTGKASFKALGIINAVVSVLVLAAVIYSFVSMPSTKQEFVAHMAIGARILLAYFVINVPKWLWGIFYGIGSIKGMRSDVATILKAAGTFIAAVSLFAILQGTFFTPYKVAVTEVPVSFKSLPQAFDGYRIVHISDAHLGTFGSDTTFVASCVNTINGLHPDAVCFTGDLVSMTAEEAKPFVSVLSRIKAKDGVFTILGNHDYAHYMPMLNDQQKEADLNELCELQRSMGWRLLDNESAIVRRGNDSIAIVGTANYGDPPFPVFGDYGKATQGLDGVFKVHMQHNPYMWRSALVGKADAPLTLSGHTHAMQFVLHLAGTRMSPSSWRYSEWGGLYMEGSQALYVNTGLGMVGPPFRIGVPPEITVITLKKAP